MTLCNADQKAFDGNLIFEMQWIIHYVDPEHHFLTWYINKIKLQKNYRLKTKQYTRPNQNDIYHTWLLKDIVNEYCNIFSFEGMLLCDW